MRRQNRRRLHRQPRTVTRHVVRRSQRADPFSSEIANTPGQHAGAVQHGGTPLSPFLADAGHLHLGKLLAGNGYWEDQPGGEGPQGAQILVLDRPDGAWAADHDFDARLPDGRPSPSRGVSHAGGRVSHVRDRERAWAIRPGAARLDVGPDGHARFSRVMPRAAGGRKRDRA